MNIQHHTLSHFAHRPVYAILFSFFLLLIGCATAQLTVELKAGPNDGNCNTKISPYPACPGERVACCVEITNGSNEDISNIVVTDHLGATTTQAISIPAGFTQAISLQFDDVPCDLNSDTLVKSVNVTATGEDTGNTFNGADSVDILLPRVSITCPADIERVCTDPDPVADQAEVMVEYTYSDGSDSVDTPAGPRTAEAHYNACYEPPVTGPGVRVDAPPCSTANDVNCTDRDFFFEYTVTFTPTFDRPGAAGACPAETLTCTQDITFVDNLPPQLLVSPLIRQADCTVDLDPSLPGNIPVNNPLDNPFVVDNCDMDLNVDCDGRPSIVWINDTTNFINDCPVEVLREWEVFDDCSNETPFVEIIRIVDQTPPTIGTCPAGATLECNEDVPDPDTAAVLGLMDNCTDVDDLVVTVSGPETCCPNPPIAFPVQINETVDGNPFGSFDVDFTPSGFPAGSVVQDVDITIDFAKQSGPCGAPDDTDYLPNLDEIEFILKGPGGTPSVILIGFNNFNTGLANFSGAVTFNDEAANPVNINPDIMPAGSHQPFQSLNAFSIPNNIDPSAGTWTLSVIDSSTDDPLCLNSAELRITACPPAPDPCDPADPNCMNRLPERYTYTVTDQCGNATTCEQKYDFVDTTDPVLTCPIIVESFHCITAIPEPLADAVPDCDSLSATAPFVSFAGPLNAANPRDLDFGSGIAAAGSTVTLILCAVGDLDNCGNERFRWTDCNGTPLNDLPGVVAPPYGCPNGAGGYNNTVVNQEVCYTFEMPAATYNALASGGCVRFLPAGVGITGGGGVRGFAGDGAFGLEAFTALGGSATDTCNLNPSTFRWVSDTPTGPANCPTGMDRVYAIQDGCGNEDTCTISYIITDDVDPVIICTTHEEPFRCLGDIPPAPADFAAFQAPTTFEDFEAYCPGLPPGWTVANNTGDPDIEWDTRSIGGNCVLNVGSSDFNGAVGTRPAAMIRPPGSYCAFAVEFDLRLDQNNGNDDAVFSFASQDSNNEYEIFFSVNDLGTDIFKVAGGVRSATLANDFFGTYEIPEAVFHHVRIVWDAISRNLLVELTDSTDGVLHSFSTTITDMDFDCGAIGFGSFNDNPAFDNVQITGTPNVDNVCQPYARIASDNCALDPDSFVVEPDIVTFDPDFPSCATRVERTYRISDACGNPASCTEVFLIIDDIPPALICPADDVVVGCIDDVPAALELADFITTPAVDETFETDPNWDVVGIGGPVFAVEDCALRQTNPNQVWGGAVRLGGIVLVPGTFCSMVADFDLQIDSNVNGHEASYVFGYLDINNYYFVQIGIFGARIFRVQGGAVTNVEPGLFPFQQGLGVTYHFHHEWNAITRELRILVSVGGGTPFIQFYDPNFDPTGPSGNGQLGFGSWDDQFTVDNVVVSGSSDCTQPVAAEICGPDQIDSLTHCDFPRRKVIPPLEPGATYTQNMPTNVPSAITIQPGASSVSFTGITPALQFFGDDYATGNWTPVGDTSRVLNRVGGLAVPVAYAGADDFANSSQGALISPNKGDHFTGFTWDGLDVDPDPAAVQNFDRSDVTMVFVISPETLGGPNGQIIWETGGAIDGAALYLDGNMLGFTAVDGPPLNMFVAMVPPVNLSNLAPFSVGQDYIMVVVGVDQSNDLLTLAAYNRFGDMEISSTALPNTPQNGGAYFDIAGTDRTGLGQFGGGGPGAAGQGGVPSTSAAQPFYGMISYVGVFGGVPDDYFENLTDPPPNMFPTMDDSLGCLTSVTRVYSVIDVCGNWASCAQEITVVDDEPPTFTVPPDVTIMCGDPVDPSNTGEPTAVMDNCDDTPRVYYTDAGAFVGNPITFYTDDDGSGAFSAGDTIVTAPFKLTEDIPTNICFDVPLFVTSWDLGVDAETFFSTFDVAINGVPYFSQGMTGYTDPPDLVGALPRLSVQLSDAGDTSTISPTTGAGTAPATGGLVTPFLGTLIPGAKNTLTLTLGDDLVLPTNEMANVIDLRGNVAVEGTGCSNLITRTWYVEDRCCNTADPQTQVITLNDVEKPTVDLVLQTNYLGCTSDNIPFLQQLELADTRGLPFPNPRDVVALLISNGLCEIESGLKTEFWSTEPINVPASQYALGFFGGPGNQNLPATIGEIVVPNLNYPFIGANQGSSPFNALSPTQQDVLVRFTGFLLPPATGTYSLRVSSLDTAAVYINNALILSEPHNNGVNTVVSLPFTLTGGVAVPIEVQYFGNVFPFKAITLEWSLSGAGGQDFGFTPIPPRAFRQNNCDFSNVMTITDNCDALPTVEITGATLTTNICERCYHVEYTVTDFCDNACVVTQAFCWTPYESTPPTIVSVPGDTNIGCFASVADAFDWLETNDLDPENYIETIIAMDNCEVASTQYWKTVTNFAGCSAEIRYYYRVFDVCSNVTECSHGFLFGTDGAPPVFTATNTLELGCNPQSFPPTAQHPGIAATDTCGVASIQLVEELDAMIEVGCVWTQHRVYVAVDDCGNDAMVTQVVRWTQDALPPVFTNTPPSLDFGCLTMADLAADSAGIMAPTATEFAPVPVTDMDEWGWQDFCTDATLELVGADTNELTACGWEAVRTYRLVDVCSNVAIHVQTHTWRVVDPLTASIPAPNDVVTLADCNANLPGPDISIIETDGGCGNVSVTWVGDTTELGECRMTLERVYEAADDCGNVTQVVQIINFSRDFTAATVLVTNPVNNLPCGNPVPAPNQVLADFVVLEGCTNVTFDPAQTITFTDAQACYTDTVYTYLLVDACLNTSAVQQVWRQFSDTTPPSLTCSNTIDLGCINELSDVPPAFPLPGIVNESCGIKGYGFSETGPTPVGTATCDEWEIERTYTVTNFCDVTDTCISTIRYRIDLESPTVDYDYIGELGCVASVDQDADGIPTSIPDEVTEIAAITAVAMDNCGILSVELVSETFQDSGPTCWSKLERVYRVYDECSNFTDLNVTYRWIDGDLVDVTAVFPAIVPMGCQNAGFNPPIDTSSITATDPCGSVHIAHAGDDAVTPLPNCLFSMVRNWTLTDVCGDVTPIAQTFIWAVDNSDPVFVDVPADQDFGCVVGFDPAMDLPDPTDLSGFVVDDACGTAASLILLNEDIDQIAVCTWESKRTYRVFDACSNQAIHVVTYTWTDDQPLTASLNNLVITLADCGVSIPAPDTNEVTAADACGDVVTTWMGDSTVLGECELTVNRQYRVTDACGNIIDLVQQIVLTDDFVAPFGTVDLPTIELGCNDPVPAPAQLGDLDFFDNCGGNVTLAATDTATLVLDCYTETTYTYTIQDPCGNQGQIQQRYRQYTDAGTPPVITQPDPVDLGCNPDYPEPDPGALSVTDNCDVVDVLWVGDDLSNVGCAYTLVRTYRAIDACGNESEVEQTYTYEVNPDAPTVDYTYDGDLGCVPGDLPTVADEITAITAVSLDPNGCEDPVVVTLLTEATDLDVCRTIITRTYRVSDGCNETLFPVVYSYTEPANVTATFVAQMPVEYGCTDDNFYPQVDPGTITATANCGVVAIEWAGDAPLEVLANCGFQVVRTWLITDMCGNEQTVDQAHVWTENNEAPVFTAWPANVDHGCQTDPMFEPPADDMGAFVVFDACAMLTAADVVLLGAVTNFQGACTYRAVRTYNVTNGCDNEANVQVEHVWRVVDPFTAAFSAGNNELNLTECNENIPAPNPAIIEAAGGCSDPIVTWVGDTTELGECRMILERTYEIADDCGNVTQLVQTINFLRDFTAATVLVTNPVNNLTCGDPVPSPNQALPDFVVLEGCNNVTFDPAQTTIFMDAQACYTDTIYTYFLVDACGNTSSVQQVWRQFSDATPPSLTCTETIDLGCINELSDIPDPFPIPAIVNESCGVKGFSFTETGPTPVGTATCDEWEIERTYTVTNFCDVIDTCISTIRYRIDLESPTVDYDYSGELGCVASGDQDAVGIPTVIPDEATEITAINLVSTDNCGIASVVLVSETFEDSGPTCWSKLVRVYRISDECSNFTDLNVTYRWIDGDLIDVDATFPATLELGCQNVGFNPPIDTASITATDPCGAVTITHAGDGAVMPLANCRFSMVRDWTFTDVCGGVTLIAQTFIWTVDNSEPVFVDVLADIDFGCVAGGINTGSTIMEDFESGVIPADWAITDLGSGSDWQVVDDGTGNNVLLQANAGLANHPFPLPGTYIGPADTFCEFTASFDLCLNDQGQGFEDAIFAWGLQPNGDGFHMVFNDNGSANDIFLQNGGTTRTLLVGAFGGAFDFNDIDCYTIQVSFNHNTSQLALRVADMNSGALLYANTWTLAASLPPGSLAWGAYNDAPDFDNVLVQGTADCSLSLPSAFDTSEFAVIDTCGTAGAVEFIGEDIDQIGVCTFESRRTYRVFDACSNQATHVVTYTWTDDQPLTAAFDAGQDVITLPGCSVAIPPPNTNSVVASDPCGDVVTTWMGDSTVLGECQLTINRQFRVTDACGNIIDLVQQINLTDDFVAPFGTVDLPVIELGCGDAAPSPATLVNLEFFDNCGGNGVTLVATDTAELVLDCYTETTFTYTIQDPCGNQGQVQQSYRQYTDVNTPPTFTQLPRTVDLGCNPVVPEPDPSSVSVTDNCDLEDVLWIGDAETVNGCAVTIQRTYRAIDKCGNQADAVLTYTLVRNIEAPTVDYTFNGDLGCVPAALPTVADDIAAIILNSDDPDACTDPVNVALLTQTEDADLCLTTITRIYRVVDNCGNETLFPLVYTYTEPANLSVDQVFQEPVEHGCAVDGFSPMVDPGTLTATSTCGNVVIEWDGDVTNMLGDCNFNVVRTWKFTDICGQTSTVEQVHTWSEDNENPVFVEWPADYDHGCQTDLNFMPPADDLAAFTVIDTCATAGSVALLAGTVDTTGPCIFVMTRTYQVVDACGNEAEHQVVHTWRVVDAFSASFISDQVINIDDCNVNIPAPDPSVIQADGGCGNPVITWEGDTTELGSCRMVLERLYRVEDDCGNVTQLVQTINFLRDFSAPTLLVSNPVNNLDCGQPAPAPNDSLDDFIVLEGCNNVTFDPAATITSSNVQSCYTDTIYTYFLTDACGNANAVQQTWRQHTDPTAPTIICSNSMDLGCINEFSDIPKAFPFPGQINEDCGIKGIGLVESGPVQDPADPCGFVITRTYTATNFCGETTDCTMEIRYRMDLLPPTITALLTPLVRDLGCDPAGADLDLLTIAPPAATAFSAEDACGTVTLAWVTDVVAQANCDFVLYRKYRAIDACDNFTDVDFEFSWREDVDAPSIGFVAPPSVVDLGCNPLLLPEADDTPVLSSDICGNTVVDVDAEETVTADGCDWTLTYNYTATDDCGNSSSVSHTYTYVIDVDPPDVVFTPPGGHLGCDPLVPTAEDYLAQIEVDDLCSPPAILTNINRITNDVVSIMTNITLSTTVVVTVSNSVAPSVTGLFINEVLSDPSGPEGVVAGEVGAEFVELFGPPGLDISCYVLTDGDVSVIIPDGTIVPADGVVLLASGLHYTNTLIDVDLNTCGCILNANGAEQWEFADLGEHLSLYDSVGLDIHAVQFGDPLLADTVGSGDEYGAFSPTNGTCDISFLVDSVGHVANVIPIAGPAGPADSDSSYQATNSAGFTTGAMTPGAPTPGALTTIQTTLLTTNVMTNTTVVQVTNEVVTVTTNVSGGLVGAITWSEDTEVTSCLVARTITYIIPDGCGNVAITSVADSWYDSTLMAPLFVEPLPAIDLGCEPPSIPNENPADVLTQGGCADVNVLFVGDVYGPGDGCRQSLVRTYQIATPCETQTVSQVITWSIDDVMPTIIAPPQTVLSGCFTTPPIPAAFADLGEFEAAGGSYSDACQVVQFFLKGESRKDDVCRSTITRTYQAVDECGNAARCEHVITWTNAATDEVPLITSTPENQDYGCVAEIPNLPTLAENIAEFSASDLCQASLPDFSNVTIDVSSSGCARTMERTFELTDQCGNSVQHVVRYQWVLDPDAPLISLPNPQVIDLRNTLLGGVDCNPTIPPADPNSVIATDICSAVSVEFIDESTTFGDCEISIARNYVARDDCGNETPFTRIYLVYTDTSSPNGAVTNPVLELACNEPFPPEAALTDLIAGDNCDSTSLDAVDSSLHATADGCTETLTRIYTIADLCGNNVLLTQIIRRPVDTNAPMVELQDIDLECINELADIPAAMPFPGNIMESCSTPSVKLTEQTVTPAANCETVITRSYLISDQCGNTTSVSHTVSYILDIAPPTIVRIDEPSRDLGCNPSVIPAPDITSIGASDDCSVQIIHLGDVTTQVGCAFTLLRTYAAEDGCGNRTEVEIEFNWIEDPVQLQAEFAAGEDIIDLECNPALLPQPDTSIINIVASGCADAQVAWVADDTVIGDCVINLLRTYRVSSPCYELELTQTWIFVRDTERPLVTVTNPVIDLGCATLADVPAADTVNFQAQDNCDLVNETTLTVSTNATVCRTTIHRRYQFVDICGNNVEVLQDISFQDVNADTEPPVFQGFPRTVQLGCNPDAIPAPDITSFLVTDNCEVDDVQWLGDDGDPIDGQGDCQRQRSRSYLATDVCGNQSTGTILYVWSVDAIPPTITAFPQDQDLGCEGASLPPADIAVITATDDCGVQSTNLLSEVVQGMGCHARLLRTYRVFDHCGNYSDVTIRYDYLDDATAPTIVSGPEDIYLGCNPSYVPDPQPSLVNTEDGCSDVSVRLYTESIGTLGCRQNIERVYVAEDQCGNQAFHTQNVSYTQDAGIPIVLVKPEFLYLGCNPESIPTGPETMLEIGEGCSVIATNFVDGAREVDGCFTYFLRTIQVEDECGNVGLAQQTIRWLENAAPPIINCLADVDLGCNPPIIPDPSLASVEASSLCSEVRKSFDPVAPDIQDGCSFTRVHVYHAEDDCGNTVSCQRTLTWRIDDHAPTITATEPSTSDGCGVDTIPPANVALIQATDECGSATVEHLGDVETREGCRVTVRRTYRVSDGCGHVEEVVTHVRLDDSEDPVITCETNIVYVDRDNEGILRIPDLTHLVTFSDDCEVIELTQHPAAGERFDTKQDVTFTVRDACGNESTCVMAIEPRTVNIEGVVWLDAGADGIPSNDNLINLGLDGIPVELYQIIRTPVYVDPPASDSDVGTPVQVGEQVKTNLVDSTTTRTAPTGELGFFEFLNVPPGEYILLMDTADLPANANINPTETSGHGTERFITIYPGSTYSMSSSDGTTVTGGNLQTEPGVTTFGFAFNPTAAEITAMAATGGTLAWEVAHEDDVLGYRVIDAATGEQVDSFILAEGNNSAYSLDVGPGSYIVQEVGTDLSTTEHDAITHYTEVDASPLGEPTRVVEGVPVDGQLETSADYVSYLVTGVGDRVLLDVSDPENPVRLIGERLVTGAGTALYFSYEAGATLRFE